MLIFNASPKIPSSKKRHIKENQTFLLLLGILSKANGFLLHDVPTNFYFYFLKFFLWPTTFGSISIDQGTIESAQNGHS